MTRFPYDSAWGGEESHTLLLAKYFRTLGYVVIFMGNCPTLLRHFSKEGFPTKKISGGKMVVTPWELLKSLFLNPVWTRNMRLGFDDLLHEYDVQALYCLSLNEKLFLTSYAGRFGVPVTWVEHQEIRNWLLKSPWRFLYQKQARLAKIVPISPKNKSVLLKELHIPAKNMVNIVNGVVLNAFKGTTRKTQKNLIVSSNRLIPKKGMMDFLQAVKILFEKGIKFRVQVFGEGEEYGRVSTFIQDELGGVALEFSPFLSKEVWQNTLLEADVYVSSARDTNETFSLATAEALAAGCKVVVTKCSGIANYLEDEKEAFLADPKNPEALADLIERALEADESMREKAQQAAASKFDQVRMLEQYEKLILRSV